MTTDNDANGFQEEVSCTDCGRPLPIEWIHQPNNPPRPACGSHKKHIKLQIVDEVGHDIRDSMRAKVKSSQYPSRKNPRQEIFSGADLRKSDGKWMEKERVIDKDNDRYYEKVVDPETGEVIHHTEESLSAHRDQKIKKPQSDGEVT